MHVSTTVRRCYSNVLQNWVIFLDTQLLMCVDSLGYGKHSDAIEAPTTAEIRITYHCAFYTFVWAMSKQLHTVLQLLRNLLSHVYIADLMVIAVFSLLQDSMLMSLYWILDSIRAPLEWREWI